MGITALRGCGTALVTPFADDGSIDEAAFGHVLKHQIDNHVNFLVPCGTTGESPTLTHEETLRVVLMTVAAARPAGIPVFAGVGGNNTARVIDLASEVEALKADGLLAVAPYYNKPTQEGLYQHFRAVAESTKLPIIVYNIAGRTGVNIETPTLARLAEIENIIGVKEASGNITQMAEVANAVPDGFAIFSGDDAITLPLLALGGVGVISVASNEVPAEIVRLVAEGLRGNFEEARSIHRRLLPLMQANFIESNPIPVKAALAMMGIVKENYRLPLVRMKAENRAKLQAVLQEVLGQAVTA
jgi:4-hydroxy-tetrahydrodipicolinate synthase